MGSYNVVSEMGMLSVGKSVCGGDSTTFSLVLRPAVPGKLQQTKESADKFRLLEKAGSLKQEAALKTAPHASHQASGMLRGKTGLLSTETHERASSASICVSLGTQGRAGSFPTIFSTQMLVS